MIRQITRISIGQTSKVVALFYFVVALIVVVVYTVAMRGGGENVFVSPFILFLFPVIYGLILFVLSAAMFWIYNQIAAKVGGVEFEFRDIGPEGQ